MAVQEVIPKSADISQYVGEWVVTCDDKIIAHNKDLTKIKKEIASCKKIPTLIKVPEERIMIF